MKAQWLFVLGFCAGAGAMLLPKVAKHVHAAAGHPHGASAPTGESLAHAEEKFEFVAKAPMQRVAPLFGADKERVWAPEWTPTFLYPSAAADMQGMVFTVAHGHLNSVWVNTEFDINNGRVQYVYVIPNAMVTVITLRLTPEENQTRVAVEYDRTALSSEANDHVRQMAKHDGRSGPEWEQQVNGYLAKQVVSGSR